MSIGPLQFAATNGPNVWDKVYGEAQIKGGSFFTSSTNVLVACTRFETLESAKIYTLCLKSKNLNYSAER